MANAELIRKMLWLADVLWGEKSRLENEMAGIVEMTQNIVAENAQIALD